MTTKFSNVTGNNKLIIMIGDAIFVLIYKIKSVGFIGDKKNKPFPVLLLLLLLLFSEISITRPV